MEVYIETTPVISDKSRAQLWIATQILLGSLFLAACAQISIPLYPVPLTLQTFGIFILAIMQGGKRAAWSTLLYLGFFSLGLPFLAGGNSHQLWWLLPQAGYLASFPIAAFVIGKMVAVREKPSPLWIVASILSGQFIVYFLGIIVLMRILSFEQSIMVGLLPFLPLAGVKLLLAASFSGAWLRWKRK
ncbi:MAG: Biotin transporter BioY [Chlamydiae bacterium]|nr:Biotin transporter BioY [Chlamydiota bacterium]